MRHARQPDAEARARVASALVCVWSADTRMDTEADRLVSPGRTLRPERHASLRLVPAGLVAFVIAGAAVAAVALAQGAKPFYFDSGQYWSLGETFVREGRFSLLNYTSPIRGYALPLLYHGLQLLGSELAWSSSVMAKLLNAVLFVLIGAVLAPRLAQIAWPSQHWGVTRRVALVGLLLVYWSGFLNFPLSDFPALAVVLLALVAVARSYAPGWMLLAGVAGGLAVDVRAADVLVIPTLLVLTIWGWWEQRGAPEHASGARHVLCALLLVGGFLAASAPQSLTAHRYFGTWSFIPGATVSLASQYLTPGLAYQRSSGYVGEDEPGTQMYYGDRAGQRLLREQPGDQIKSTGQYLGLILSHPITMSALLARHVINGLDQRYSTPYIEHLKSWSQLWMRLAGFLLVFLALVRVLWPAARRSLGPARWRYPVALLLSCATAIPDAMETRYELPIYLLSYMLVLSPGWPSPIGPAAAGVRRLLTPAGILVAYLAFMAVVWHVLSTASSQLHFYP
jgi:hypothetical protein